jgi:hypothetical protein
MVVYMFRRLAESGFLTASTLLSNDCNSQWQFAPTASPPLDPQESIVGPQGFGKMVFYMFKRLSDSGLLIASTLLSND